MCLIIILLSSDTAHKYTYIHRTHMYLLHTTHTQLICKIHTYNNWNNGDIGGNSASTAPPQLKSPVIIQLTVVLYSCSSVHRYSGQVKGCHETRTRRKPDPGTMTVPVWAYTKTQSDALANICFTHELVETNSAFNLVRCQDYGMDAIEFNLISAIWWKWQNLMIL